MPDSTLIQDLAQSLDNPELSDTKIVVEGREIHVNSFILRSRCKHFQVAHSGAWSESARVSNPMHGASTTTTIKVDSAVKYDSMMQLLRFLYTDQVSVHTGDAMELIALADFYQLPRLRAMVEDFVVQNISVDDVASVFEAAVDYHADGLASQCEQFVVANFAAVALTEGFAALPKELMAQLVRATAERL